MPSLDRALGWINTNPPSTADLHGRVVLIDFWTYTCINWRRTLPYVRAWAAKYKDRGLVVIGVHTPEFGFEKDLDNVRRVAKAQGVDYPIAIDSDYAIWNAFRNRYWPALYFIDAQGRIRHHQFGEGDFDESEHVIQQLLAESGHSDVNRTFVAPAAGGAEVAADWTNLATPETYVGYGRSDAFASFSSAVLDRPRVYAMPQALRLNMWALSGDWTMKRESAVSNAANAKIAFRFHARDVHLVAGPSNAAAAVRFRVTLDSQPPRSAHGVDVDADGNGSVAEPRMYQLIRQSAPIIDRRIEIEFFEPGAELFVFTFG